MKRLKIAVFIFNLLLWLAGFMLIVVGAWLLLEQSTGHLFNLFMKSLTPHDAVNTLSYIFFALGFLVLSVGFIGCRASLHNSRCILMVYIGLLIALIITELVTASVVGFLSYRAVSGLENRLLHKLADLYGHDPTSDLAFSHSLDFAQYKFNCCGIYGDGDYNGTAWWRDNRLRGSKKNVPLTCCILKNHEANYADSPMSSVSRVFHKDYKKPWLQPQPKDIAACQAEDPEAHIDYRHKKGCLELASNWLRDDSLKLFFFVIAIAGIQVIAIVASLILYRAIQDMQDYE